jgi:hypothetical protein
MILTVEEQATIRRIAGRILRASEVQSAARYQNLVLAGTQAAHAVKMAVCETGSVTLSYSELLKQRIHFAMFAAMRSFGQPQAPESTVEAV